MSTTSSCTVHAHRGITRESGILTWLIERTWILHSNYWLTWSKYPTYLNWFSTEPPSPLNESRASGPRRRNSWKTCQKCSSCMSLHLALGCTLIPSPASSIRSHNSSPTASIGRGGRCTRSVKSPRHTNTPFRNHYKVTFTLTSPISHLSRYPSNFYVYMSSSRISSCSRCAVIAFHHFCWKICSYAHKLLSINMHARVNSAVTR